MAEEGGNTVQGFINGGAWDDYNKAVKLQKKSDSEYSDSENLPSSPCQSKYEARQILEGLNNKARDYFGENPSQRFLAMQAAIEQELAINHLSIEEMSTSEELFMKVMAMLEGKSLDLHNVFLYIRGLNNLGILWSGRGDKCSAKALHFLEEADRVYREYKQSDSRTPYTVEHILRGTPVDEFTASDKVEFEMLHTLTKYYLAQIHLRMGNKEQSRRCCLQTLMRQLEYARYDAADWAGNASHLSSDFVTARDFPTARHCLAAASVVMEELGPVDLVGGGGVEDEDPEGMEKLRELHANLAQFWANYCISLLDRSVKVAGRDEGDDGTGHDGDTGHEAEASEETEKIRHFPSLELTKYEEQVQDKLVTTFDEAKKVFLTGQQYIKQARSYYTPDVHASQNVRVLRGMCHLYKSFSYFEPCLENSCEMHKRRIALLKGVYAELNPLHFLCETQYFIFVEQELLFEIGEAYSCMVKAKHDLYKKNAYASAADAAEINKLAEEGLQAFQALRDLLEPEMPEKYEDDFVKNALYTHFHTGRLYSLMIENSRENKIDLLTKSAREYEEIIDYCEENPDQLHYVESVHSVCKNMIFALRGILNTY